MSIEHKYCTISGRTVAELDFDQDEGHPDCTALKLTLLNKIAALHANGVTDFFTNAEYGVGLFGAEAVIALRENLDIRLHVIMAFEGQANRYSREVRERFFNIHATADSVEILSAREYDGCFHEADMQMIDNSDFLLTDNSDSFIARYAVKRGIRSELIERLPLEIF